MIEDIIFKISFYSSNSHSLNVTEEMNSNLWHLRMGYLNFQYLVLLRKHNMVNGLSYINIDDEVCEGCIFGKQHKESFLNRTWTARERLALVHSDLCGPMEIVSFGKAHYFLTFIDDYSRKTWVYFCKRSLKCFFIFLSLRNWLKIKVV
jgi:hypothetical protein